MGNDIDRSDCGRCGGSGQVIEEVAGRTGYVPCDICDNVPEYAVPDDPPENPRERINEIEERIDEIQVEKQEWKRIRQMLKSARENLVAVASEDLVPEDDQAVLEHIAHQIGTRRFDRYDHGLHQEKDALGREKAELQTYIDVLERQENDND